MKKAYNFLILSMLFIVSCTKIESSEDDIPVLENISISTIQTGLDIVNLKVDQEQFNYMYRKFRSDTIVPAFVYYQSNTGLSILDSVSCEIEIKGAASAANAMKSIGISFKNPIDNSVNKLISPSNLMSHHSLKALKTIRLRNSGNDFGFTMLKDLAYTELAIHAGLNLELMYGKPVHAFVNGEYLGLLNLRTESNANGISGLNDAQTNEITLLKVDVDNGKLEYREGDEDRANELIEAIKDEDEDKLQRLIDVDSFIDYIIFQDYIGNRDWPVNNMRVYSKNDDKFRFILYDLDYAAFNTKKPLIPSFEYLDHDMAIMYNALREDTDFEDKFDSRQEVLYSRMNPTIFNNILERFSNRIEDDIPYLISKYNSPQSSFHWRMTISELARDFNRRDYYIRNKYDLQL